jgi:hypothetical protein
LDEGNPHETDRLHTTEILTALLALEDAPWSDLKRAGGKTYTEAKDKLKEIQRKLDDGLPVTPNTYKVKEALTAFLKYGFRRRRGRLVGRALAHAVHAHPAVGALDPQPLGAHGADAGSSRFHVD